MSGMKIFKVIFMLKVVYEADFVDSNYADNISPKLIKYILRNKFLRVLHYCIIGENKCFKPNPKFNPCLYLRLNPDVSKTGFPTLHYLRYGCFEQRSIDTNSLNIIPQPAQHAFNAIKPATYYFGLNDIAATNDFEARFSTLDALNQINKAEEEPQPTGTRFCAHNKQIEIPPHIIPEISTITGIHGAYSFHTLLNWNSTIPYFTIEWKNNQQSVMFYNGENEFSLVSINQLKSQIEKIIEPSGITKINICNHAKSDMVAIEQCAILVKDLTGTECQLMHVDDLFERTGIWLDDGQLNVSANKLSLLVDTILKKQQFFKGSFETITSHVEWIHLGYVNQVLHHHNVSYDTFEADCISIRENLTHKTETFSYKETTYEITAMPGTEKIETLPAIIACYLYQFHAKFLKVFLFIDGDKIKFFDDKALTDDAKLNLKKAYASISISKLS